MRITPSKVLNYAAAQFLTRIQKIKSLSPSLLCGFENIAAILLGKKVRFSFDENVDLFIAKEAQKKRFFKNFERGTWLYRRGIEVRSDFLFNSYCLQKITFKSDDVIIDCGANSGDLTLKLFELCADVVYVGVEPSPQDYEVLSYNVTDKKAHLINKALGDRNDTLKFYICTENGDSSLIEPSSYTGSIDVEVVKLETLVNSLDLTKVKLVKVEAEGSEPEILKGAQGILDRVEYIAVDGGYERGVNSEQTFTTVTNFLLDNGFEMEDIFFPWYRALFKNKAMK